jgi:hypothetical protein
MWQGSLFEQFPNTQRRGLPFPPHTHTTKRKFKIKIKNSKNSIEKAKRMEKIKPTRKIKN